MSATSSLTRATAAGQTFIISACAAAGSLAIVSDMRQWACVGYPSSCARSARSFTIRVMIPFVSFASPLSPRLLNFFHTASRRSRRAENARNGSTLERVFTITHPSLRPRSVAAALAADTSDGGSPARSASESSTVQVFSSASTLALNSEKSVASSWLMAESRFFCAASSFAPRRTKLSYVRVVRRSCSGVSPADSRARYTASIRSNSARLNAISSSAAASLGCHSRTSFWYSGVLLLSRITPNSRSTRSRSRPDRCMAAIVFSNVGALVAPAIAAISVRSSASAASNAAGKYSGFTWSHGGTPP